MRHKCKRHHLGRAADQRKALMRTLATSFFVHEEIKTTMAKAKALKEYAERIITFAKKGDLHSRRLASKYIYDVVTGDSVCPVCKGADFQQDQTDGEIKCTCGSKLITETVLMKLFNKIGPRYNDRKGGYTRIFRTEPRRGDAAEMALIQLVQEVQVVQE